MRRFLLSILTLLAIAGCDSIPVMAADLPRAQPIKAAPLVVQQCPFCGWYAGGAIGYMWNTTGHDVFVTPENVSSLVASLGGSPQGVMGGVFGGAGATFANGLLYGGIEADIYFGNATGSASAPGLITVNSKNSWMGSIGPRFGFVLFNDLLLYGTVGFAYGNPEASFTLSDGSTFSSSGTKTGYDWGVGLEHQFYNDWLIRLQYKRFDFGKIDVANGSSATITVNSNTQIDTVMLGLLHRF